MYPMLNCALSHAIVSISIPAVIAPALLAIFYSQEQEATNIFLIILLLTDVGIAVELWCTNGLFTILHLLDVNLNPDYTLIQIPLMVYY